MGRASTQGLLLIALGTLFLLRNLGIITSLQQWWPVVLIVAGIIILIDKKR